MAVASGRVDLQRVDAKRAEIEAIVRAHTPAEVRGLRELVTSIERGLDREWRQRMRRWIDG